jgi:hypothetical protein
MNFEAKVGSTIRFGDIFIKVQACRKPPPIEKNEAAAFLQIYQADESGSVQTEIKDDKSKSSWIFSGWMFSSSPAISAMDHPIYDVWVLDCLGRDPEPLPPPEQQVVEQENQETPENKDQNATDADEKSATDAAIKPNETNSDLNTSSETKADEAAPSITNEQKSDEPSIDEILQPEKATPETGTASDDEIIFSPDVPSQTQESQPQSNENTKQNNVPSSEPDIVPQELPQEVPQAPQPQNPSSNLDGIY